MKGRSRKGLRYALLCLGAALGIYTGVVAKEAHDHNERTATITYGQLQDIVADDNPIMSELDLSLGRGNRDFEAFISIALGGDVDFSDRPARYPALFDRTVRDQVELHYEAMPQDKCTNDLCYPPPPTVEAMISLAARITDANLEYDYEAHFIHHTEPAFDNDHLLAGVVEFIIRSGEVGVEYARVSSMTPDEIIGYGQGMCEQYADVFNATLRRLNAMFGSPYDLSVGAIASMPGNPRNTFYEGLSRLLNFYHFHRDSGNVQHVSNIIVAHDPHRQTQPRIYFVDSQQMDPFEDGDQIISVDRERFSRFSAALTLAEEYSVRVYSRSNDFDPRGSLWDHIVIDDASARILIDDLGLREDVVSHVMDNTEPTILTLYEIGALQRYDGEADTERIIEYFGREGWLVSRLREHRAGEIHFEQRLPDLDLCAGMPADAGAGAQEDAR